MKTRSVIVLVSTIAALGVAGAVATANANDGLPAPDAPFAGYSAEDIRRAQILSPTFEQLSALPGFVDGGFREGTDELIFYWEGDPSAEALQYVQEARDRGVVAHVVPSALSHEEAVEVFARVGDELDKWEAERLGFSRDIATGVLTVKVEDTPAGRRAVEAITRDTELWSSFGADVLFEFEVGGGVMFDTTQHDPSRVELARE